jgi:hypothetical protein
MRRVLVLAIALCVTVEAAYADTVTWDGTVGNWTDTTKWSLARQPVSGDDAVIPGGTVALNDAITGANAPDKIVLSGGNLQGVVANSGNGVVDSPIEVLANANINGGVSKTRGDQVASKLQGSISDGATTGNLTLIGGGKKLIVGSTALLPDNSGFSGNWVLQDNDLWFSGASSASADSPLGTGDVSMNGGALLFNVVTDTITNDISVESGGGTLYNRAGPGSHTATITGDISLSGDLTLLCRANSEKSPELVVDSAIVGPYKVVADANAGNPGQGPNYRIRMTNGGNSYGALEKINNGRLIVTDPGAFGTGMVTVSGGRLDLEDFGSSWDLGGLPFVVASGAELQFGSADDTLIVKSLDLGGDTFGPGDYDITGTHLSQQSNNVDFATFFNGTGTVEIFSPIPEPAGLGLLGMLLMGLRKKRN